MGANQHLPYPMQPGSGTWDLLPGLTCLGRAAELSRGVQGVGVQRLGENDNDYLVAAAFAPQSGLLLGHRLALEVGRPVYQNPDGPQLEADWTAMLGWPLLF